jgi:tetratricopeptide (TPR) repeat protein
MAGSGFRRSRSIRQLRRGYKLHDRFRYKRAGLAFAKAAQSEDPQVAAEANFWLGAVREDLGDIEAARLAYNAVLNSRVPGYGPNAGVLLGKMMIEHGDLAAAQSALERAIAYRDQPLRPRPADPTQGIQRDSVNWPFHAAVGLEALMERRGDQEGARKARELSYELHESEELAHIELNRGEQF